MTVYNTHIGFKIFGLLFSIPIIIVCTYILLVPFITVPPDTIMAEMQNSWPPPGYLFYLIPMCLIGINILALIILVCVFRKKAVITHKAIILTNVFITRKLDFKEIEHAYVEFFNLCLETKSKKKIYLNLIGLRTLDLEENLYEKLNNNRLKNIG